MRAIFSNPEFVDSWMVINNKEKNFLLKSAWAKNKHKIFEKHLRQKRCAIRRSTVILLFFKKSKVLMM